MKKTTRRKCDDSFFGIDSQKSFYWAGFIAADGNVARSRSRISIDLSRVDLEHLIKFSNDIKFDGIIHNTERIKNNKKLFGSRIRLSSKEMCSDLKRFGITPNKTKTYCIPKIIEAHDLFSHFIRGYFDGDGSWILNKTGGFACKFVGTKECVKIIQKTLQTECNLERASVNECNGAWYFSYGGTHNCRKIRSFLYKDCCVCLTRKMDIIYCNKVDEYFKFYKGSKLVIGTNIGDGTKIFLEGARFGKSLGFSPKAIAGCCNGYQKTHGEYRWRYATGEEVKEYLKLQQNNA